MLEVEEVKLKDVEITTTEFGFETKIYIKQNYTNLLLNFNAICPINWKSGLMICFLNWA